MLTSEWKVCISTLCVLVAFPPVTASPTGASPSPSAQNPKPREPFLTCKSRHTEDIIWHTGSDKAKGESGMNFEWGPCSQELAERWKSSLHAESKRSFTADRLHKNPISCRPNLQCLLLQTVWGSQFSTSFAKVNFGHICVDWLGVTLCRFSLEKTPQLCPKQYKQHGRQILGPPLENDFHTYKWMQLP